MMTETLINDAKDKVKSLYSENKRLWCWIYTVISRYNHFGYSHKCVIITKMCSHNIGSYVNVWQLVSHLAIVTCDNVFKNVI